MVVSAVEEFRKNRYKVCMEDGTHLVLYKGEVRHYKIEEGTELNEAVYHEIYYDVLGKRAKKRAMALLEKMDRTEKGLRDKLREGQYPEELIDNAVAYVKHYHYIDDARYAAHYLNGHRQKSRMELKQNLLGKGIEKEVIEEVMTDYEPQQEEEKIAELLRKRKYNPKECDAKDKQKLYGYLMRKGFRSEDILHVMNLE